MPAIRTALISAITLAAALLAPAAQASTVTVFTDRAAFESALSGVSVDSLNGVSVRSHSGVFNRPGYTYATTDAYGCVQHQGCGGNSVLGFDDAYLWSYKAVDTFTFSRAVHGFGFDFSAPVGFFDVNPLIDGVKAVPTSGFFGLLYSDARTSFTVGQTVAYMLMDNITAGVAVAAAPAKVPEPATLGLLGIGVLGLALARWRKRAA